MAFCSNSGFGRLVDTDVIYTGASITCGGITVNPGDTVREFLSVVFLCSNDIVVDVEGNSLPIPDGTGIKVAFVGSGTYTQSGGPDVVVPSGHMGILNWDGSVWYLGSSVEMPEQVADGEIKEGDDRAISGDTVNREDYWNLSKGRVRAVGINLFNKNDVLEGYIIERDSITLNSNGIISNIIDLTGNESNSLTISGLNSQIRWAFHYQFLDSNLDVVEHGFIPSVTDGPLPDQTISYTNSDIVYFRITVFSGRSGETSDLDTLQIEFGIESSSYEEFKGVVYEAYGLGFESTYAKKVSGYPNEQNDIASKGYVDDANNKVLSYTLYSDSDEFFNLNNPLFDRIYSQSVPTESRLGYIREVERDGFINSISFMVGRNQYTDSVINVRVGFVDVVGSFDVGDEDIVVSTTFESTELPLDGVTLKTVSLGADVKVKSGDILVVLFDTPTAMPVYDTSATGYDILYRTTASPSRWSYGYRVSSGIIFNFVNQSFDDYISQLLGISDGFEGLKIVTIGDSITYHSGSWARLLFGKYGDNFLNLAISGCRFQDYPETDINLDDNLPYNDRDNTALNQLLRLAKKLTPIGQQIKINNPYRDEEFIVPVEYGTGTGEFTQPDLVVVALGTNDSNYAGDIYNILDTPLNDLDRKAGMVEAMRFFTEYLKALCPDALIIFSTPIQASWGSSRRFDITKQKRDKILENCNYYAIPVIDSFIKSGISEKFEVQGSQGRYLSDGLHPDDNGKMLMARFLGKEILKLIPLKEI